MIYGSGREIAGGEEKKRSAWGGARGKADEEDQVRRSADVEGEADRDVASALVHLIMSDAPDESFSRWDEAFRRQARRALDQVVLVESRWWVSEEFPTLALVISDFRPDQAITERLSLGGIGIDREAGQELVDHQGVQVGWVVVMLAVIAVDGQADAADAAECADISFMFLDFCGAAYASEDQAQSWTTLEVNRIVAKSLL